MRLRIQELIPVASIVLLGACAHASLPSTSADKDIAVSQQTKPRPPGLYSQDEFPEMTPEEMGRRFLRFINGLERYDQLTLEQLEHVMRVKLDGPEGTRGKQFNIHVPDSDWHHVVYFSVEKNPPHHRSAGLSFLHEQDTFRVDMAPVCQLDFNAYVEALLAMGFEEREDMAQYEHAHYVPVMNERGETVETIVPGRRRPMSYFSRGDVGMMIDYRAESAEPRSTSRRACVLTIGVGEAAQRR